MQFRLIRLLEMCFTVAVALSGALGCKSSKLCDDGACERPSSWATSSLDAALTTVMGVGDAAQLTALDAAKFDADVVASQPCGGDGSCPSGGVCHPDLGVCVECFEDGHCSAPEHLCRKRLDPRGNACVGCASGADCPSGACVEEVCVACERGSNVGCDDSAPLCVTDLDGVPACVECAEDSDCSDPARPVCDRQAQACVLCLTDGSSCHGGQRCVVEGRNDAAESSRRCVECTPETAADDCRLDVPYCVAEQCSVCDPESGAGCDEEHPYCRLSSELTADSGAFETAVLVDAAVSASNAVCVQCRTSDDCSDGAQCASGECVECTRDSDCTSAEASACDVALHQCVPCSVSEQCEHVDGAKVCHGAEGDAGSARCVECDATDPSACNAGDDVCITVPSDEQFTCSGRKSGQVGFCGECAADADCSRGQRCVELAAPSAQTGHYCVYLAGQQGAPPSCADASARPFIRAVETTSVDGAFGTYCTLDTTSCDVFGRFKQACTSDAQCGSITDGAWCDLEDDTGRCSYVCEGDGDCPQPGGDCVNDRCDP